MSKLYLSVALGLAFALQLALPASTIFRHERALAHGEAFSFRCGPVDPVDLFRGRFVALDFEESQLSRSEVDFEVRPGQSIYLPVTVGADGFAELLPPVSSAPDSGPYVTARVRWLTSDQVWLQLPFDRYYLREDLARQAEKAYREAISSDDAEAHVRVRLHGNVAVLEELYIDDLPVRRYLEDGPPLAP